MVGNAVLCAVKCSYLKKQHQRTYSAMLFYYSPPEAVIFVLSSRIHTCSSGSLAVKVRKVRVASQIKGLSGLAGRTSLTVAWNVGRLGTMSDILLPLLHPEKMLYPTTTLWHFRETKWSIVRWGGEIYEPPLFLKGSSTL